MYNQSRYSESFIFIETRISSSFLHFIIRLTLVDSIRLSFTEVIISFSTLWLKKFSSLLKSIYIFFCFNFLYFSNIDKYSKIAINKLHLFSFCYEKCYIYTSISCLQANVIYWKRFMSFLSMWLLSRHIIFKLFYTKDITIQKIQIQLSQNC